MQRNFVTRRDGGAHVERVVLRGAADPAEGRQGFPVGEYRWITVAAPGRDDLQLALEPNANPAGKAFQQAMFAQKIPVASLESTDLDADHARLVARGVAFTQAPTVAGTVKIAVFSDTAPTVMTCGRNCFSH